MTTQIKKEKGYIVLSDVNKIQCLNCDAIIAHSGYSRHIKTKRCSGVGSPSNSSHNVKTADKYVQLRERSKARRTALIESIGLEAVREKDRDYKRKQRIIGSTKRIIPNPDTQTDHDASVDEYRRTLNEIKLEPDKKERLRLTKIVTEARNSIKTEEDIPKAIILLQDGVKAINDIESKETNCDKLINRLDKKSLSGRGEIARPTLVLYIKCISKVYETIYKEKFGCTDFDWLDDIDGVISTIENMKLGLASKAKMINAIYSILARIEGYDYIKNEYKKVNSKYNDTLKYERGKNVSTKKEIDNHINWTKLKSYSPSHWTNRDKFLHKLYTAIPPRRLKDYQLLKYIKGKSITHVIGMDKNYNYIACNKKGNPFTIVFNAYKTSKGYGQFIINLNQPDRKPDFMFSEIKSTMKAYVQSHGINSGDLFFPNTLGTVNINFSKEINDLFYKTGKTVSCNGLRHSYITNFLDTNPKASDNTVLTIAKYLGHSGGMLRSYRKSDLDESDEE
jgi:hypothetical protein